MTKEKPLGYPRKSNMNGKRAKKIRRVVKQVFPDVINEVDRRIVYKITKERYKSGKIPG